MFAKKFDRGIDAGMPTNSCCAVWGLVERGVDEVWVIGRVVE